MTTLTKLETALYSSHLSLTRCGDEFTAELDSVHLDEVLEASGYTLLEALQNLESQLS